MFVTALLWAAPGAAADPDGFEPNNSIDAATAITPWYYAGLTIDPVGDVDHYNITLNAGDEVAVTICNMVTMFNLYLFDTTRIQRNSSTQGMSSTEKVWWFDVPVSGNYTIQVIGSGSDSGSYDMRVEAPVIDDACEQNDDIESAWEISVPSTTSNLAFYDGDYYKVWLTADQYLNTTVQSGPEVGLMGIFFQVYNSTYGLVENGLSSPSYSHSILLKAPAVGWYYVVVNVTNPFIWGNYTIILKDIVDDAYEENDLASNAAPINPDSYNDVVDLYYNPVLMDVDWYQIQVNAGESMWAMVLTSPITGTTFQLTTNMGVVLADAAPHPAMGYLFANYSVTTSGAYKVRVYPTAEPHPIKYGLILARMNMTHPADIAYQPGETGHGITWNIEDSYVNIATMGGGAPPPEKLPAKVYMDGVPLADDYTWNRTKPVTLDVDGLAEGTYAFKIIAKNHLNVTVEDTVTVTVKTSVSPGDTTPDGIPGYPMAILAGFAVVALLALVGRKRSIIIRK